MRAVGIYSNNGLMMKIITIFLCCLLISACSATVSSIKRPVSYYQNTKPKDIVQQSLLGHSTVGENDDKLNKLLNHQLQLPTLNRIAILKLNSNVHRLYYSNDSHQLNMSLVESLITTLRASNRIYDASFLPSILLPERPTIAALREAAARFQADLILAYQSTCDSYQKFQLINPNETKAYCSVESVLIDVRSGIIFQSNVSSQDFIATKTMDDNSFQETIIKAELEAIAKALGAIANNIVSYLDTAPILN